MTRREERARDLTYVAATSGVARREQDFASRIRGDELSRSTVVSGTQACAVGVTTQASMGG